MHIKLHQPTTAPARVATAAVVGRVTQQHVTQQQHNVKCRAAVMAPSAADRVGNEPLDQAAGEKQAFCTSTHQHTGGPNRFFRG